MTDFVLVPKADLQPLADQFHSGWGHDLRAHEVRSRIETMATRWLAASPPIPDELREKVARVIAMHGLCTISGEKREPHPASLWVREEWERRILELIPTEAEARCFELADALLALLTNTNPERGR